MKHISQILPLALDRIANNHPDNMRAFSNAELWHPTAYEYRAKSEAVRSGDIDPSKHRGQADCVIGSAGTSEADCGESHPDCMGAETN